MKIGLYFGTFNPIHIGHLIVANHIAEHSDLDQIWMVVTPHNPLKNKETLLEDYHRLNMVTLATEDFPKIKPSDIEFKLSLPNYTIHTLDHLKEKYPSYQFSLIIGEDNLHTFHKWKSYEAILNNYEIFVYPRIIANSDLEYKTNDIANHPNINSVDAPIVEISSTAIRNNIRNGKNIRPLLSPKVWDYINKHHLYEND